MLDETILIHAMEAFNHDNDDDDVDVDGGDGGGGGVNAALTHISMANAIFCLHVKTFPSYGFYSYSNSITTTRV